MFIESSERFYEVYLWDDEIALQKYLDDKKGGKRACTACGRAGKGSYQAACHRRGDGRSQTVEIYPGGKPPGFLRGVHETAWI